MDYTIEEMSDSKAKKLIRSLKFIASLSDQKINALSQSLLNFQGSMAFNIDEIDKLSKEVDIDSSIVAEALASLTSIYANSITLNIDFSDAFDRFTLGTFDANDKTKIKTLVSKITPILKSFWENLERQILPTLPIDEIIGMRTRIINIAQFETDFSLIDDIDKYTTAIKRFKAMALITFILGKDRREITCSADEGDIDNMIKWLNFTKKQLAIVNNTNNG